MIPVIAAAMARGAALRALTASELRAVAAQKTANISKRVARLKARGIETDAVRQFDALRAAPAAQTRNELLGRAAELTKLDNNPGLRATTAPKVYTREQTRAARDALIARASNPATAQHMSQQELGQALSAMRRRMTAQANRLAKIGHSAAVAEYRKFQAMSTLDKALTLNQMRRRAKILAKIAGSKTWTPQGVRDVEARGVKTFGSAYANANPQQKSALYDLMHEYQERYNVTSPEAGDMIHNLINTQNLHVRYVTRGDGSLQAVVGHTAHAVEIAAARAAAKDAAKMRFMQPTGKPRVGKRLAL